MLKLFDVFKLGIVVPAAGKVAEMQGIVRDLGGEYVIVSATSAEEQRCLTVGNFKNNTNDTFEVVIREWSPELQDSQIWRVSQEADHEGLRYFIDGRGGRLKIFYNEGREVCTYPVQQLLGERWVVYFESNDRVSIKPWIHPFGGNRLTVIDWNAVRIEGHGGSRPNEVLWRFERPLEVHFKGSAIDLEEGEYAIFTRVGVEQNRWMCLTAANTQNHSRLIIKEWNRTDDGATQTWTISPHPHLGHRNKTLRLQGRDLYLDVTNGRGDAVQLYQHAQVNDHVSWRMVPPMGAPGHDRNVYVVPKISNAAGHAHLRRLDVKDGNATSGTLVQIDQHNDTNAQRWLFQRIDHIQVPEIVENITREHHDNISAWLREHSVSCPPTELNRARYTVLTHYRNDGGWTPGSSDSPNVLRASIYLQLTSVQGQNLLPDAIQNLSLPARMQQEMQNLATQDEILKLDEILQLLEVLVDNVVN